MSLSSKFIKKMIILRKKGYSLSEISNYFHIAKSTASRKVGNILPDEEYKKILQNKRNSSTKIRNAKEKKSLEEAENLISNLSTKEKLLFISALYWAEGSKKDFGLSNTDPALIQVFVNGLRQLFLIPDERLRISIRIYEDLNRDDCLQFWSKIINIPQEKFVSVNVIPGKKKGKLLYGMCRVRVTKGEVLLKKLKAINLVTHQKFVPIA